MKLLTESSQRPCEVDAYSAQRRQETCLRSHSCQTPKSKAHEQTNEQRNECIVTKREWSFAWYSREGGQVAVGQRKSGRKSASLHHQRGGWCSWLPVREVFETSAKTCLFPVLSLKLDLFGLVKNDCLINLLIFIYFIKIISDCLRKENKSSHLK